MKEPALAELSDEELVERIVQLATEMSKCELTQHYDRLTFKMGDARKTLHARGSEAVKKLLPFLDHPIPRVRQIAAVICYDEAQDCNRVLRTLRTQKNPNTSIEALLFLLDHDHEHAKEFSEDMNRRYGNQSDPPP
ncbi:MAG TPA: DUF2019 domain-containing protein [Alphaproteobacteria bacterium]|nr:DUF2019 domain-containing protein [Alphaproteobacteria bacterium]